MWFNHKFFKYGTAVLLLLLIIYMLGKIEFFIGPFKQFVAILFLPILIAGLLYYLMRPLVLLFCKAKIPKPLSILIVFILIIFIIYLFSSYTGSIIVKQFQQLQSDLPNIIRVAIDKSNEIINEKSLGSFITPNFEQQLQTMLQNSVPFVTGSIFNFITTLTSIATVFLIVPFILFYFLNDDKKMLPNLLNFVPEKYHERTKEIINEIDKTLSVYIIGQGILAIVIGVLMYFGYIIIGVDYAMLLAIFALVTSFIPIFGSIFGILPAILISLAHSPFDAVKIIILMIIVQQVQGNLIYPWLMGKRLAIHPLTVILLFLGAGSLYGLVGMVVVVPAYAVLKIIVEHLFDLYNSIREEKKLSELKKNNTI